MRFIPAHRSSDLWAVFGAELWLTAYPLPAQVRTSMPRYEVATELGLSPGQLSGWRNEHLAAGSAEALALRKVEQAEVQRLKRENKRLEEEVEILRKAAAFFARGIA